MIIIILQCKISGHSDYSGHQRWEIFTTPLFRETWPMLSFPLQLPRLIDNIVVISIFKVITTATIAIILRVHHLYIITT